MYQPIPGLDLLLVSMPWALPQTPSLQLGILQAAVTREGLQSSCYSAFLDFHEYLQKAGVGNSPLEFMGDDVLDYTGEWVFADSGFYPDQATSMKAAQATFNEALLAKLTLVKPVAEQFLKDLAEAILRRPPRVLGLTTTFNQTISSLALARRVKAGNPHVRILLGGAHCEGELGVGVLRHFPWVDAVVNGEAEELVAPVVRHLLNPNLPMPPTGVSYRMADGSLSIHAHPCVTTPADRFVMPDFTEFFAMLDSLEVGKNLKPMLMIPIENSRGCWWGQKHHCRFCALNGETISFRSKPPEKALADLRAHVERYQHHRFDAVDNIMDYRYFDTLLPALDAEDLDLEFFWETKSNLSLDQVIRLRRAGVVIIQPGIESLSTPILKLMNKGVTAIQNLRLLKYCAWLDIEVRWNLIAGFPGEPVEAYAAMADLVPSLTPFDPPTFTRLALMRFSPYFNHPEAYGLTILGPDRKYRALFPFPKEVVMELAYDFEFRRNQGPDPTTYTEDLKREVEAWRKAAKSARHTLTHHRAGASLFIEDKRPNLAYSTTRLDPVEARIYLACEDIASLDRILHDPIVAKAGVRIGDLEDFLVQLESARLVFREGDQVLALSTPGRDRIRLPPEARRTA